MQLGERKQEGMQSSPKDVRMNESVLLKSIVLGDIPKLQELESLYIMHAQLLYSTVHCCDVIHIFTCSAERYLVWQFVFIALLYIHVLFIHLLNSGYVF